MTIQNVVLEHTQTVQLILIIVIQNSQGKIVV